MWSFPSASLGSARRPGGTHVVACSVCFVNVRAVCVAWTHVVSVSMLLAVDVRALPASCSNRANGTPLVHLFWPVHTLSGGIAGV